jgi:hypothetical protein
LQTQTPEWREATLISDYFFHLSAAETQQMLEEVLGVLEKYRTEDLTAPIPEGSKQVTVQIQAYPRET